MKKYLTIIFILLLATPDRSTEAAMNDAAAHISGGIGEGGMEQMKARESEYNLKLLLVNERGEYLADVKVTISDSKGNIVLDTTTEGPVLLARLQPGSYHISATHVRLGKSMSRKMNIGRSGLASATIRFPVN